MDPLDDFEFKPLTEGLGFHKKSVNLQEQVKEAGLVEKSMPKSTPAAPPTHSKDAVSRSAAQALDELLKTLDAPSSPAAQMRQKNLEITEPLPRTSDKKATSFEMPLPGPATPMPIPMPGTDAVISTKKSKPSVQLNVKQSTGTRRSAADSPASLLVAVPASFPSAILDGIVVLALTMIFMTALVSVTKVDVLNLMMNSQQDVTTQGSLAILYVAVWLMYSVIARSFFGKTLGEWTFDHQLGSAQDQQQALYPLKVVARTLVTLVTGIVVLPLISMLMGQDLAGRISGVQLYQQKGS